MIDYFRFKFKDYYIESETDNMTMNYYLYKNKNYSVGYIDSQVDYYKVKIKKREKVIVNVDTKKSNYSTDEASNINLYCSNDSGEKDDRFYVELLGEENGVLKYEISLIPTLEYYINVSHNLYDTEVYENNQKLENNLKRVLPNSSINEYNFDIKSYSFKLSGNINWEDENNKYDIRPKSMTVKLLQDGVEYKSIEVTSENNCSYTFENVPTFKDDITMYEYEVVEEKIPTYETIYNGYNITNSIKLKDIEVTKIWNDNENKALKRPENIKLQIKEKDILLDEFEVNNTNQWKHTFKLPKYDNLGDEIEYIVDEDVSSEFYTKNIVGNTVINTFTVPDEKVRIAATKVWDDNNNRAGKRPDSITLQIKNNGVVVAEQVVSESNNWKYTFELPKYNETGDEIEYTVDEKELNESGKFYIKNIVENIITNKFVVPEDRIKIIGTKVWNDNGNVNGKRDTSVILQLKVGDNIISEEEVSDKNNWNYEFEAPKYDVLGNEIEYYIDERDSRNKFYKKVLVDNNTVINEFVVPDERINVEVVKIWNDNNNEAEKRPESVTLQVKDGERVVASHVVSEADNWKYTFEIPKYDSLGNEINYTVDEEYTNKFYIKEIVGNTITNRFVVPEDKIKIIGTKVWEDNEDFAKKRPKSVILQVIANNEVITEHEVNNANNWSYEFELAKYDDYGDEIEYHIDERNVGSNFYEKELTNATTVTNKFKVPDEMIRLEVMKTWDDNENKAGKRPDNITLQVKNNGVVVTEQVVSESDEWKHTFKLAKYNETGDEITYTVDEKELDEEISKFYIKEIVGNVITNKFVVPEDRIKIVGKKVWNDNGNLGGKRDISVILQLKVGDNIISEVQISDKNNWSYEFEVPKYDELGNEIEYYIDERDSGNKFYKKILTDKNIVTNEFVVPEEKVLVKAVKKWEDNNDEYGKRPESVVLQVYNKDKLVAEEKVSTDNNWSYEFKLPKYDEYGDEIKYTVNEKEIYKHYEKKLEGYTVVNKYKKVDEENREENNVVNEVDVDTSDINVIVYIVIFFVAIIGIVTLIMFIRKNKSNKK